MESSFNGKEEHKPRGVVRHSISQGDPLPDGMAPGPQLPVIGCLGRGRIPLIVGILPVASLKGVIIPWHPPTPGSLPAHHVDEAAGRSASSSLKAVWVENYDSLTQVFFASLWVPQPS